MAEQLEFDPAMFGMKSNHGMLRADKNPSTGANSQGIQAGGAPPSNFGYNHQQQQGNRGRGGGGQRGGFNRGRGGNKGGRGGARGGFNAGQRSNDGQPFKVSYTIEDVVSSVKVQSYLLHYTDFNFVCSDNASIMMDQAMALAVSSSHQCSKILGSISPEAWLAILQDRQCFTDMHGTLQGPEQALPQHFNSM